jgi:hypothetical protein
MGWGERLSCRSSVLFTPWSLVPDDGIEGGDEFSGGCDDGDELGLSGGDESVVERLEDRVVAGGDQGAHEQGGADGGPSPADEALVASWPEFRVHGARPTSAATWRRSSDPSLGSSAMRVRTMVLPIPGTEASRSSFAAQAGELRTASSMSPSRQTKNASSPGRTCTSIRSFDTSIPTTMVAAIQSHPCASGLRFERPKRLFGVDGSAGEDRGSPAGLVSLRGVGLPPATATASIADAAL